MLCKYDREVYSQISNNLILNYILKIISHIAHSYIYGPHTSKFVLNCPNKLRHSQISSKNSFINWFFTRIYMKSWKRFRYTKLLWACVPQHSLVNWKISNHSFNHTLLNISLANTWPQNVDLLVCIWKHHGVPSSDYTKCGQIYCSFCITIVVSSRTQIPTSTIIYVGTV